MFGDFSCDAVGCKYANQMYRLMYILCLLYILAYVSAVPPIEISQNKESLINIMVLTIHCIYNNDILYDINLI